MKIVSSDIVYEFDRGDNTLRENPLLLNQVLNVLETEIYYYSPMSRTYTIRCNLTVEKLYKLEILLEGKINAQYFSNVKRKT